MHVAEVRIFDTPSNFGYVVRVEARSTYYIFMVKRVVGKNLNGKLVYSCGNGVTEDFDKGDKYIGGHINTDESIEISLGESGIASMSKNDALKVSGVLTQVFKIISSAMRE